MSVSIVWLDHQNAKIFHFSDDRMERKVLAIRGEEDESTERICAELGDSKKILLLGPAGADRKLADNIERLRPDLARRILGCESLNEADDSAVAGYAIKYFRKPLETGTG